MHSGKGLRCCSGEQSFVVANLVVEVAFVYCACQVVYPGYATLGGYRLGQKFEHLILCKDIAESGVCRPMYSLDEVYQRLVNTQGIIMTTLIRTRIIRFSFNKLRKIYICLSNFLNYYVVITYS
jgi:hypothetical protein